MPVDPPSYLPPEDEVVVLVGAHQDLTWQVVVSGADPGLMTMLHVCCGGTTVQASGFGGPSLCPGELVNEWRGRTDDLPYFVTARTAPSVTGVTQ